MPFLKDHPDYKSYESREFAVADLPSEFSSAFQGFICGKCKDPKELKAVLLHIAGIIPTEPTTNWGWDFLVEDLSYYTRKLIEKPLPKVMDSLATIILKGYCSTTMDELNEFLEELESGYVLVNEGAFGYCWSLREGVESRSESLTETVAALQDICSQTLGHLEQAREQISSASTERDLKDSVRDCMSALETLLKKLSNESDIKEATTTLKNDKGWGPDLIVKDGLSIWNHLHQIYPDVRHGNPTSTSMSDEEAMYWVDRITAIIRYLIRVERKRTVA